jgi:hypothetical protein
MCSSKRLPRIPGMLVVLACMAGVAGFSVPGCSGDATVPPEAQAKAKENFKKRFGDFGEKTKGRKTSR